MSREASGALLGGSQEEMVLSSPLGLFPEVRHNAQGILNVKAAVPSLARAQNGSERLANDGAGAELQLVWGFLGQPPCSPGQSRIGRCPLASLPSEGRHCPLVFTASRGSVVAVVAATRSLE